MAETMRRATEAEAETAGDGGPEDPAGFGFEPRTELGRLILAARREFLAANGRFLAREELERELAERRGAPYRSDDERGRAGPEPTSTPAS